MLAMQNLANVTKHPEGKHGEINVHLRLALPSLVEILKNFPAVTKNVCLDTSVTSLNRIAFTVVKWRDIVVIFASFDAWQVVGRGL